MSTRITLSTKLVLEACLKYEQARNDRINTNLDKIRERMKKKKKFIFFGDRRFTDQEIESIIDGKHWWYSAEGFFSGSFRLREELRCSLQWEEVEELLFAAKATKSDTMEVCVMDLHNISEFYELQS